MTREEKKDLTKWNNFIKAMKAKGALIAETKPEDPAPKKDKPKFNFI